MEQNRTGMSVRSCDSHFNMSALLIALAVFCRIAMLNNSTQSKSFFFVVRGYLN